VTARPGAGGASYMLPLRVGGKIVVPDKIEPIKGPRAALLSFSVFRAGSAKNDRVWVGPLSFLTNKLGAGLDYARQPSPVRPHRPERARRTMALYMSATRTFIGSGW